MTCNEIRSSFVSFFNAKGHRVVSSAPMVIKDDPTLMFTNAGMNQFKEIFLGNKPISDKRVVNSQKCLRVSGKHNDLEEVGHDTYHHTMFEMLGNWSFGDYFKKEAIDWAWEFLTSTLKIDKTKLYATVFAGDETDQTGKDEESYSLWKKYLPENQILTGSKKDNFWEMGESGPCGPCSEIHIDLRNETEKAKIPGRDLVNMGDPRVIEIWNLVFIQYNRKANGTLEPLPLKHVDTGMGFERLCRVIQGKDSNYDTDIFQGIIKEIESLSHVAYGNSIATDISMRVIADHLRAVSFSIADGQLPSNNKAGYVIRRILRRAIRYGYTYLNLHEPFIYKLVAILSNEMGDAYPEIRAQRQLIERVIKEEEASFLRTLANGIKLLEEIAVTAQKKNTTEINGNDAFLLYDTYGFPLDLTELILKEKNMTVDRKGFEMSMNKQKSRSKNAAKQDVDDWIIVNESNNQEFIGYTHDVAKVHISRYRKVSSKGKDLFQIVLDRTPFYAESGGQVGDSGVLESGTEKIKVLDTLKENNLNVHIAENLPSDPFQEFTAKVDASRRKNIASNHTATHLLHHALRKVLGKHVEQKGSLVNSDHLRFDFSHFQKVTDSELLQVEKLVNQAIRANIFLEEKRNVTMDEAVRMGAMALFGEKYGDSVRVISFGESVELCGGIHASATGQIGLFKITSESAIAAGVRRIEAETGAKAETFVQQQIDTLKSISDLLKNQKDVLKVVENMQDENTKLRKQIENFEQALVVETGNEVKKQISSLNGMNFIATQVKLPSLGSLKDLSHQLKNEVENLFAILAWTDGDKVGLSVAISDNLVSDKGLNAGNVIRELSIFIDGGGGGQPSLATAGGKNPKGINEALVKGREIAEKA